MMTFALILAVLPSIIVFIMVYKLDTIEKEPAPLLAKLFIGGVFACLLSMLLGGLGRMGLQSAYSGQNLMLFQFVDSFLLKALSEQACTFLVLLLLTWKDKEYNYTFDAVVYAVTTGLGVTVTGNLIHVFRSSDFKIRVLLLSLVGHVISAVFMGYFYGKAKNSEGSKEIGAVRMFLAVTLLIPCIMFGIYDFCMQIQMPVFYVFLIVYEVVCAILALWEIVYLSGHDSKLTGLADVELSQEETASFKETERW
ncbi:MAG: PrsW family intramembrane metalloprotease [Lachnospiraceae bacterium]|nr:PrsW family intramembrane metalloprotease [Lachnospiraceae bacterium]